jgi:ATP-dependent DNA helicase RecG
MDIALIENVIRQGESDTLEFKKSTGQLKAAMETLCAFLNNHGGTVLIGVDGQGRMLGQDVTDATQQEIANELKKIEPPAQIQISYTSLPTYKRVIVLQVPSGTHAPYVYDGRAFQRKLTSTQRMPQQRYDQLIAQRFHLNFSWEKLQAEGYGINDLDHDLILSIVRKAVEVRRMPEEALRQNFTQLLGALQLLANQHPNNAAVALFAKKISSYYFQCQLKMARFKGLNRQEFLDSNLVYGNVFELLERGMLFVERHLPLAARIEVGRLERVETPIIPFNAIREALINALCHRDYSNHSGSVGLAIYDDRMEIFNNGGLPPGVTLEAIKEGFSEPRNPLIADVFYRCNLIERWGRGIPNIISSCKAANDPEPLFVADNIQFKVLFKFPSSLKPTVVAEKEAGILLTARQQEIIAILTHAKDGMKAKEIREKLQDPPAERTLRDDLAVLKAQGLIQSVGRGKNALWYREVPRM